MQTELYYCIGRYYDAGVGRWISLDVADVLAASPMEFSDKNLYAYCDNNPVVRIDCSGCFWDTVFDVMFVGWDIYNLCVNDGFKNWRNWLH